MMSLLIHTRFVGGLDDGNSWRVQIPIFVGNRTNIVALMSRNLTGTYLAVLRINV